MKNKAIVFLVSIVVVTIGILIATVVLNQQTIVEGATSSVSSSNPSTDQLLEVPSAPSTSEVPAETPSEPDSGEPTESIPSEETPSKPVESTSNKPPTNPVPEYTKEQLEYMESIGLTPDRLEEIRENASVCEHCGGEDGPYHRWIKDIDCPQCGVFVPKRTCHTCK